MLCCKKGCGASSLLPHPPAAHIYVIVYMLVCAVRLLVCVVCLFVCSLPPTCSAQLALCSCAGCGGSDATPTGVMDPKPSALGGAPCCTGIMGTGRLLSSSTWWLSSRVNRQLTAQGLPPTLNSGHRPVGSVIHAYTIWYSMNQLTCDE